jgi:hypothetical protein
LRNILDKNMGKFPKGAIGEDLAISMSSDKVLDNGDICMDGGILID